MNIFILVYFLFHRGLVTDFCEPPNLFALAVNSPPAQLLAGSCGGGPEGKHYMVNWFVNAEGDHLYMEPGQKPATVDSQGHIYAHPHTHPHSHSQPDTHRQNLGNQNPKSPESGGSVIGVIAGGIKALINKVRDRQVGFSFGRKNQPGVRPVSVVDPKYELELEDASTRTARQYAILSKWRSML